MLQYRINRLALYFQYVAEERVRVDGFVVQYHRYDDNDDNRDRQAVPGSDVRHTVLRQLEPDTAYSIVMHSFNRHGRSTLSNVVVMTTLASVDTLESVGQ